MLAVQKLLLVANSRRLRLMALATVASFVGLSLLIGSANLARGAADDQILEVNVTNDVNLRSGEPQIAVNPKNPRQIAIVEFAYGSKEKPSYKFALSSQERGALMQERNWTWPAMPAISNDGGKTWKHNSLLGPLVVPPYSNRTEYPLFGGGDAMIAYGPDGTLYVAGNIIPMTREGMDINYSHGGVLMAYSVDGGKTFSPAKMSEQPIDRPWLKVDQTTGKAYIASTGFYDSATGKHNISGVGTQDRWLVTWSSRLDAISKPRRMGGPEAGLVASLGNDLAAGHGVVASIFIVGGMGRYPGAAAPAPAPMPVSLRRVVPSGTDCVPGKLPACLIFQTSSDDGASWTRHFVPTPAGFTGGTNLAADSGRSGRYAIGMQVNGKFMTVVTEDSGKSWSAPALIPETGSGDDFKMRVAYSPNGVLVYIWKKKRDDLNPTPLPAGGESGFDVYTDISCDGGKSWPAPIRVSSKPSPAGVGRSDDLSYLTADTRYAHLVWGDRRLNDEILKLPGAVDGGSQAFYARVPFSMVSKGKTCGR